MNDEFPDFRTVEVVDESPLFIFHLQVDREVFKRYDWFDTVEQILIARDEKAAREFASKRGYRRIWKSRKSCKCRRVGIAFGNNEDVLISAMSRGKEP